MVGSTNLMGGCHTEERIREHENVSRRAARDRTAELLTAVGRPNAGERAKLRQDFGTAFVSIRHDTGLVANMADRIAVNKPAGSSSTARSVISSNGPAHPHASGPARFHRATRPGNGSGG